MILIFYIIYRFSGRPEADHSPPPGAEVGNAWGCPSAPPMRLHGVVLR